MGMLEVALTPDRMGCGNWRWHLTGLEVAGAPDRMGCGTGGCAAPDRMGCGNVGGGTDT